MNRIRLLCGLGLLFVLATVGPAQEPLATFTGTVKQIDRRTLAVEGSDSNIVRFNCTGKTQYYRGAQKLDRSAVKLGARVTVEAKLALDLTFDAVNVRLEPPESKPSPPPQ